MRRRVWARTRCGAIAAAAATVLALSVAACSISTEEQPRPITRETTVAPPASLAP